MAQDVGEYPHRLSDPQQAPFSHGVAALQVPVGRPRAWIDEFPSWKPSVANPLTDCAKGLRVMGSLRTVFAELNDTEAKPARTEIQVPKRIVKEVVCNQESDRQKNEAQV